MNTAASSDEKIMAALAHASAMLAFVGPLVPVIIWSTQRKKSKYVSFHALQAMGYQALLFWLWIIIMIPIMILFVLLIPLLGAFMESSQDAAMAPFLIQLPIFLTVFGFMGIFFITGIAGAVSCLLGRDFRYPLLGSWLGRYLSYDGNPDSQIAEMQEDNWVSGICHATAILQMWGVVTPLIVWFTQKERSGRLRFQSLQAFVYQVIALITYMLGMAVYMAFFIGMIFTMTLGGTMGSSELQGPPGFMMVIFLVVMLVFWFIIMILMPVYYLLAGLAGIRVIRGHHFRYPILGKILEKRMATIQSPEVVS